MQNGKARLKKRKTFLVEGIAGNGKRVFPGNGVPFWTKGIIFKKEEMRCKPGEGGVPFAMGRSKICKKMGHYCAVAKVMSNEDRKPESRVPPETKCGALLPLRNKHHCC
ncbi:unnamed protein product [Gongylonema pulchrum]|uniref:Uncharacterized protein n=1 Tax=Gongylonema pulchrum TaxID=637853 RepID=A0A183ETJ3_9BILA|nr:unnamed protein product [Gongylonema pulchrum]